MSSESNEEKSHQKEDKRDDNVGYIEHQGRLFTTFPLYILNKFIYAVLVLYFLCLIMLFVFS